MASKRLLENEHVEEEQEEPVKKKKKKKRARFNDEDDNDNSELSKSDIALVSDHFFFFFHSPLIFDYFVFEINKYIDYIKTLINFFIHPKKLHLKCSVFIERGRYRHCGKSVCIKFHVSQETRSSFGAKC